MEFGLKLVSGYFGLAFGYGILLKYFHLAVFFPWDCFWIFFEVHVVVDGQNWGH